MRSNSENHTLTLLSSPFNGDASGIEECLWNNTNLRNGTYVYKKNLTKKLLASMFDMEYRDIEMLIASQL